MDFMFDSFNVDGAVRWSKGDCGLTLSAYALASVGDVKVGYSFHISQWKAQLDASVAIAYPLRVYGNGSFVMGVDILCSHHASFLQFKYSPRDLYNRLMFGVRVVKNYGSGLTSDAICLSMLHDYKTSLSGARFGVGRAGSRDWDLCWWFTGEAV